MDTTTKSPRQNTTGRATGLAIALGAVGIAAIVLALSLPGTPAQATGTTPVAPVTSLPTDHANHATETELATGEPHDEPAATTITGTDTDTLAMIEDTIALYVAAGLDLPNLRINVHPTNEGCNGHQGLYRKGGDLYRIDICTAHPITVAHELAHAWEHHTIDDETRTRYVDLVGASEWYDAEAPHPVRAIETAADAIAWGVQERPVQRMLAGHHGDELAAYELLTGSPSPRIAHWDDPVPAHASPLPVEGSTLATAQNWS